MESNNHYSHPFLLLTTLLLLTMLTTTTCATITTNNNNNNNTTSSIPTQEINKILDALIGSGDTSINKWVSILSLSNPLLSLTLFIPQQQQHTATTQLLDPFSFPYHVVPQRLAFSDLLLLPPNSRLPTLLPGKTIAVTDNSAANFSLDDTPLTHPDLYSTPSLAVHGVKTLLDYSLFGDASALPSPPFLPVGDTWKSAAAASSSATLNRFLLFCFILQLLVFV